MSFFGLFGSKKKEHTEEQHAVAPAVAPAPQAAPPDVQQDIMAAISAAVYVVMYSSENTTAKVEIKHPLKKLTQAHYQQLRKYMDILTSVKEFVADNYKWTFFLVGTDIDQSLADDIENMKVKSKTGLIFEKNNYNVEIYVRTWKSIFNEYRIKYSSLYNRLKC